MPTFNLDMDLYFWLIDRGGLTDDQRNKVELEHKRVKLYREHAQNCENGVYIGRLIMEIRKTIIKKSKKPFTIDSNLFNLKSMNTS